MKRTSSLIVLLGIVVSATAQSNFIASLAPEVPTPENSDISGSAAFSLTGSAVSFTIRFGLESIIPTSAHLRGENEEFKFELGTPFIVIHSPGPWPDGYDGSTTFSGSFLLPDSLRADLVAGRTDLFLPGSAVGDFSGAVLPVSIARPVIDGLVRQGSLFRFHFTAEPLYRYAVEYAESVKTPQWSPLTNILVEMQTVEAVVTDSVTNGPARFYRVRKESTQSGIIGQVFICGCPAQRAGDICCGPYQTGITVKTEGGASVTNLTTGQDGHFDLLLEPGDYVLVPDGAGQSTFPIVGTVPVRVEKRQFTTVRIEYDNGIR
jgi:hypothetical protein